ncbi:hypothetical protein IAD21_00254 [Abditibacteriota bacterium]|nr:hypothetical protein IAD21_00254 [Abditibacteriota bacterium]
MKKVLVIGCPGSGKSHFSRELAAKTGLPLFALDSFYQRNVWHADARRKKAQWRAFVAELVSAEEWIIDGNYKSTFDIRVAMADTIIFLDYPRWLTVLRVFKRRLQYHRRRRPDMPAEWKERISWDFLIFVWTYRAVERRPVLTLLQNRRDSCRGPSCSIHILENPCDARNFLADLSP